jgi:hypothetical protein
MPSHRTHCLRIELRTATKTRKVLMAARWNSLVSRARPELIRAPMSVARRDHAVEGHKSSGTPEFLKRRTLETLESTVAFIAWKH